MLDIDYDTYAEGEAELGWLNSSLRVSASKPFDLDAFLLEAISQLRTELQGLGAETAHLKAIGLWEGFFGVANLISSESPPELSLPSKCQVEACDIIVNARVACDPAVLEAKVHKVIAEVCQKREATAEFRQTQSFRPGRPVPTHRYAKTD